MTETGKSSRCTTWSDWEEAWDSIGVQSGWTYADAVFLDLLAGLLSRAGHGRFLEAGSGSGHISIRLAGRDDPCVLVDYVRRALDLGRAEFRAAGVRGLFVAGDLRTLPFAESTFGLTWNAGILQTVFPEEQREMLAEMKRVTRTGGWVAVIVPRTEGRSYQRRKLRLERRGRWPYGGYEAPSEEIVRSFESCGFDEIKVRRFGSLDGLGETPLLGRLISFLLNRTPMARPLENLFQSLFPGSGYWVMITGRVE